MTKLMNLLGESTGMIIKPEKSHLVFNLAISGLTSLALHQFYKDRKNYRYTSSFGYSIITSLSYYISQGSDFNKVAFTIINSLGSLTIFMGLTFHLLDEREK